MANYRLSSSAAGDIERIFEFGIDQFGLEEALDFRDRLVIRLSHIAEAPYQYPAVDDIKPGYRRSVFGSHAIYYQVLENTIVIARILERRTATWNHSAEVVLRQDQAVRRRPYRAYGQAGRRRSWRNPARPFGFAPGGRPLRRTARPMPHIALRRSPGGSDRRTANRIDSMSPSTAPGHQDPAGSL